MDPQAHVGRPALGLVLSGGAANGAFEAGVVAAMHEAGLRPTVLSGTSAGGLNAAALAVGMDASALADLWRATAARDVYRLRRDVWRLLRLRGLLRRAGLAGRVLDAIGWTWLMDTAPLRRRLVDVLGGERVDVGDGLVLALSAVEAASGDLVRFTNVLPPERRAGPRFRRVDLGVEHLMATSAIPLLFRPADVDGEGFWDGGLVANTPLAPSLAYEPEAVVVVTTATRVRPAREPASLGEAVSLLIDNVLAHSLAADLRRAEAVNELCRVAGETPWRRLVDLLVVEPTGLDLGGGLDFSRELAERRIRLGREVGAKAIEQWLARRR